MISEQTKREIQAAMEKIAWGEPVILKPGMEYTSMTDRKLKRFVLTPELILQLFIEGTSNVRIVKGLPSGCVVKSHTYDHVSGTWQFIVWHPSYDVVRVGEPIPLVDIQAHSECDKREDTTLSDECKVYNKL